MANEEYPKRVKLDYMPMDHWDQDRGYSHATGWEVTLSPERGDTWYEYEDSNGELFLAR